MSIDLRPRRKDSLLLGSDRRILCCWGLTEGFFTTGVGRKDSLLLRSAAEPRADGDGM